VKTRTEHTKSFRGAAFVGDDEPRQVLPLDRMREAGKHPECGLLNVSGLFYFLLFAAALTTGCSEPTEVSIPAGQRCNGKQYVELPEHVCGRDFG
jgi:hypothetical protein